MIVVLILFWYAWSFLFHFASLLRGREDGIVALSYCYACTINKERVFSSSRK